MNNLYRYSYSGSDVQAFIYFPTIESNIVRLESLHTISVSVHEAKSQARALGYRGAKGIAKGVRTIAGSMILTVIEDHPLRDLINLSSAAGTNQPNSFGGWSLDRSRSGVGTALSQFDYTNRLPNLLPPFNILLNYVSEGSQYSSREIPTTDIRFNGVAGNTFDIEGASSLIEGVDIIDYGQVTSVSDVVTEITVSFIALDHKPLAKNTFGTDIIPIQSEDDKRHAMLMAGLRVPYRAANPVEQEYRNYIQNSIKETTEALQAEGRSPEEIKTMLNYFGLGG